MIFARAWRPFKIKKITNFIDVSWENKKVQITQNYVLTTLKI